jgi:hypothetical protein
MGDRKLNTIVIDEDPLCILRILCVIIVLLYLKKKAKPQHQEFIRDT